MRNSIFGFNQEKLCSIRKERVKENSDNIELLSLDVTDALLLSYISNAIGAPKMQRIDDEDTGLCYVWLRRSKILQDLPILCIKENMLSKRLAKLVYLGLLDVKTIANNKGKGSRSYYAKTELFESLQNSGPDVKNYTCNDEPDVINYTRNCEPDVKDYTCNSVPDVKNYKSNNKLFYNSELDIDIENTSPAASTSSFLGSNKQTKQPNLYQSCIAMINDFTDNRQLRDKLVFFLDMILEQKKLHGRKQFSGMLNGLATLMNGDTQKGISIVQYSIEGGYAKFYERNDNNNRRFNRASTIRDIEGIPEESIQRYTDEERRQIKEDLKNGKYEWI